MVSTTDERVNQPWKLLITVMSQGTSRSHKRIYRKLKTPEGYQATQSRGEGNLGAAINPTAHCFGHSGTQADQIIPCIPAINADHQAAAHLAPWNVVPQGVCSPPGPHLLWRGLHMARNPDTSHVLFPLGISRLPLRGRDLHMARNPDTIHVLFPQAWPGHITPPLAWVTPPHGADSRWRYASPSCGRCPGSPSQHPRCSGCTHRPWRSSQSCRQPRWQRRRRPPG